MSDPEPAPPPDRARTRTRTREERIRILLFVHLFLAIQIIVPIGYYAWRDDRYDERFAWRMFSSIRMAECGTGPKQKAPPAFLIGDARKPAPLRTTFHTAWLELAQRGRRDVIEAMARRLCADNPGQSIRVQYDCRQLDGTVTAMSAGGWDVCQTGGRL